MAAMAFTSELAEFSPRRKYLVGVSGGCDSMVLLDWLHGLGFRQLVVCHLNHQLRGRASGADARLVDRAAARLGLPCIIESVPVARKPGGHSLETAARHERHAFFARCAKASRCGRIFLAHHADDQAETVLMNVLRGTGLHGLGGMRSITELQVEGTRLVLLRPLLGFGREEMRAYAAGHGVKFREDESNRSGDFQRNRVRKDLLPLAVAVMQREVRSALLRLAEMAREDDAFLQGQAEGLKQGDILETKILLAAPLALQRRVLHAWLQHWRIPLISFELIESVRRIASPKSGVARCNLPGGGWVRRTAGRLYVEKED